MNIAILLATYNSSNFIREQLDSLYNQTLLDWTIYVHDDGSTDNTLDIIEEYRQKYGNIEVIAPNIKHLGPKKNFMFLLGNVEADYYFFCDHDDVWLPFKIELSINSIKEKENGGSKPVIFHSDCTIVDGNLNVIDKSMWHYARIIPEIMHNKKYVMTSCFITGCTLCINNKAKKIIPPIPDNAIMHDWWIGLNAVLKNATVISSHKQTILYRLHGKNDSGINNITILNYIRLFAKHFFQSEYDRKIAPFIKEYNIKYYKFYKFKLIMKRFLHTYK